MADKIPTVPEDQIKGNIPSSPPGGTNERNGCMVIGLIVVEDASLLNGYGNAYFDIYATTSEETRRILEEEIQDIVVSLLDNLRTFIETCVTFFAFIDQDAINRIIDELGGLDYINIGAQANDLSKVFETILQQLITS